MKLACGIFGANDNHTGFWLAKLEEKTSLKNLGVDGKIILR
jgi:hypothetical protein